MSIQVFIVKGIFLNNGVNSSSSNLIVTYSDCTITNEIHNLIKHSFKQLQESNHSSYL